MIKSVSITMATNANVATQDMRTKSPLPHSTPSPNSQWHTITPTLQETKEWVESLYEFIVTHRALCEAHTVDFFTQSHWESVICEGWRVEVEREGVSVEDIINPTAGAKEGMFVCLLFVLSVSLSLSLSHSLSLPPFLSGSLRHFLFTAKSLSLPLVMDAGCASIPDQLARFGMTAKKSHEVSNFADYVTKLTREQDLYQVLDEEGEKEMEGLEKDRAKHTVYMARVYYRAIQHTLLLLLITHTKFSDFKNPLFSAY